MHWIAPTDMDRLKDQVELGRFVAFDVPRIDNANYIWIQIFDSVLNEKGRDGFVMADSAFDARVSEQELRRQIIEIRALNVATHPNLN